MSKFELTSDSDLDGNQQTCKRLIAYNSTAILALRRAPKEVRGSWIHLKVTVERKNFTHNRLPYSHCSPKSLSHKMPLHSGAHLGLQKEQEARKASALWLVTFPSLRMFQCSQFSGCLFQVNRAQPTDHVLPPISWSQAYLTILREGIP